MRSRRLLTDIINAAVLGAIGGQVIKSITNDGLPLWRLIAVIASAVFTVWRGVGR